MNPPSFNAVVAALHPHPADCQCRECAVARAVDLEHWQDYRAGVI